MTSDLAPINRFPTRPPRPPIYARPHRDTPCGSRDHAGLPRGPENKGVFLLHHGRALFTPALDPPWQGGSLGPILVKFDAFGRHREGRRIVPFMRGLLEEVGQLFGVRMTSEDGPERTTPER